MGLPPISTPFLVAKVIIDWLLKHPTVIAIRDGFFDGYKECTKIRRVPYKQRLDEHISSGPAYIKGFSLGFAETIEANLEEFLKMLIPVYSAWKLAEALHRLGTLLSDSALAREAGKQLACQLCDELVAASEKPERFARLHGKLTAELVITVATFLPGGQEVAATRAEIALTRAQPIIRRGVGFARKSLDRGLRKGFGQVFRESIALRESISPPNHKPKHIAPHPQTKERKLISPEQRSTQPAVPARNPARMAIPEKATSTPKYKPSEQPGELLPGTKSHISQEVFFNSAQRSLFLDFIKIVNEVCMERAATKATKRIKFTALDKRLNEIEKEVNEIRKLFPSEIPDKARRKRVAGLIREAAKIGRKRWNSTRRLIWNELYNDMDFIRLVQNTGVILPTDFGKSNRAALIRVANPSTGKIVLKPLNIDHITPIAHNPFKALDPTNYRLMTPTENSVFLEALRRGRGPVSNDPLERWLLQNGLSPEERKALLLEEYSE